MNYPRFKPLVVAIRLALLAYARQPAKSEHEKSGT